MPLIILATHGLLDVAAIKSCHKCGRLALLTHLLTWGAAAESWLTSLAAWFSLNEESLEQAGAGRISTPNKWNTFMSFQRRPKTINLRSERHVLSNSIHVLPPVRPASSSPHLEEYRLLHHRNTTFLQQPRLPTFLSAIATPIKT